MNQYYFRKKRFRPLELQICHSRKLRWLSFFYQLIVFFIIFFQWNTTCDEFRSKFVSKIEKIELNSLSEWSECVGDAGARIFSGDRNRKRSTSAIRKSKWRFNNDTLMLSGDRNRKRSTSAIRKSKWRFNNDTLMLEMRVQWDLAEYFLLLLIVAITNLTETKSVIQNWDIFHDVSIMF